MDVINKPQTPLIQAALKRGKERIIITGYEMYIKQAIAQEEIWLPNYRWQ